jgi:pimeloyl-ACP methyl ester carboxylesterase
VTIPKEHGYFRTRDGVRLFYSIEGPKDAPPLVFAYGLVCSKLQWKYQMDHFRRDHRVIYLDYRGHGQSDKPTDPKTVTIESCALDLLDLFNEFGIDKAPVLGHSLGVNIILDFYRIAPKRVSALVLANGTPKDPFETMFHHNFLQVAFPAIKTAHALFPDLVQKFWQSQGGNPINQQFVAMAGFNTKYASMDDINEYLRMTTVVGVDVFLNLLADFMASDATHWLHEVKVPTLVIAGEKDLITPPKNQRIFAELIPDSQFALIPEGSHCPQMEKKELVNDILRKFLSRAEHPLIGKGKVSKKKPARKAVKGPRAARVEARNN